MNAETTNQVRAVQNYYDSVNFDYEHYWAGKHANALHFGYFDGDIASHQDSLVRLNAVVAEIAEITSSDRVLDAGCGYGGTAVWLAENIGCESVGITIVPYQVRKGNRIARNSPVSDRISIQERDYTDTKFDNETFTKIVGIESIVHCENKADFLAEAYRLLKPGGKLMIAEYMLRDDPPLNFEEMKRTKRWLDGWVMPNLLSSSEYCALAKAQGFVNVAFEDRTQYISRSVAKCRRNAAPFMPIVSLLTKLHIINNVRRDFTFANYDIYECMKDGLWKYLFMVVEKPL